MLSRFDWYNSEEKFMGLPLGVPSGKKKLLGLGIT